MFWANKFTTRSNDASHPNRSGRISGQRHVSGFIDGLDKKHELHQRSLDPGLVSEVMSGITAAWSRQAAGRSPPGPLPRPRRALRRDCNAQGSRLRAIAAIARLCAASLAFSGCRTKPAPPRRRPSCNCGQRASPRAARSRKSSKPWRIKTPSLGAHRIRGNQDRPARSQDREAENHQARARASTGCGRTAAAAITASRWRNTRPLASLARSRPAPTPFPRSAATSSTSSRPATPWFSITHPSRRPLRRRRRARLQRGHLSRNRH